MKESWRHLQRIFVFISLLMIFSENVRGNDCTTAFGLTVLTPAPPYSCATPVVQAFSGTCSNLFNYTPNGCTNQATCAEDLWFQFDPNDVNFPTDQYNVDFELSFNFAANAEVRYYLIYAESKDSGNGDPCAWTNTNSQAFTLRYSGCWAVTTGGFNATVNARGMDGSGTYYLLLERVTGSGGSVSICTQLVSTCNPPANDRAASPTTLTSGNGIDSNAAAGGSGSWTDAIGGTTICATKQRMQNECPGPHTEDHFLDDDVVCITDGSTGDVFLPGTGARIFRCVGVNESIDNSVFFQFDPPVTPQNDDWYLHIGNMDCPDAGPDSLTVMVSDNFDPADAANTTILLDNTLNYTCGNIGAQNNFPSADGVFGPLTLNNGTTYTIIVDGVKGAGCTFDMILTRSIINPVLPVEFVYFEGVNQGIQNILTWKTRGENQAYFQVERSLNGTDFLPIGKMAAVKGQEYRFTDNPAPANITYYRLQVADVNGNLTTSEIVQINRQGLAFVIHELSPMPFRDQLDIRFSIKEESIVYLEITDITGKLLLEENRLFSPGTFAWTPATYSLPAGVFFLRLSQGRENIIRKVIKQ
ncbi:MAG: T9SS type A sorting domain-containing protein [Bacteroidia bacterium]|nr:T9SS type A sorting domain-containing protein [Bacteroidia bacterium]